MKEKEKLFDKENIILNVEKMTKKSIVKNQMSRSRLAKKKSWQERGITLIALVVTIIILLILAGVTLNMALSQDGLFSKTKEAADKYERAQSDEEDEIEKIEYATEGIYITEIKEISTAEEFSEISQKVSEGNSFEGTLIKLTSDVNLEGENWTPIGSEENPFAGVFDGKEHKITNLQLNNSDIEYEGLFGYNTGIIKNVTIESAKITTVKFCGVICGFSNGTIENCHNIGEDITCESATYLGGMVGLMGNDAVIRNCSNSCNITANTISNNISLGRVAGIVASGEPYGGTVECCFNKGNISVTSKENNPTAGGIAGQRANINSCYNTGKISATLEGNDAGANVPAAGGIIGQIGTEHLVKACYNTGTISVTAPEGKSSARKGYITGLLLDGKLEDCFYQENDSGIQGYHMETNREGEASNVEKFDDVGEWKTRIIESSEDKFKLSDANKNPILYWE